MPNLPYPDRSPTKQLVSIHTCRDAYDRPSSRPNPASLRGMQKTHVIGTHDLALDIPLLQFVAILAQQVSGIVLTVRSDLVRLANILDPSIRVVAASDCQGHAQGLSLAALPAILKNSVRAEELASYPFLACPGDAPETGTAVRELAKGRPVVGIFPSPAEAHCAWLPVVEEVQGICWMHADTLEAACGLHVQWKDMLDRAAVLECLDLALTDDLVTAQLCAALGKEVWWLGGHASAPHRSEGILAGSLFPTPLPSVECRSAATIKNDIRTWYNAYYDTLLETFSANHCNPGINSH